jgi:hypothetical protein
VPAVGIDHGAITVGVGATLNAPGAENLVWDALWSTRAAGGKSYEKREEEH